MDAKIISYINLHLYVASGPTGKLTEYFFEILWIKKLNHAFSKVTPKIELN